MRAVVASTLIGLTILSTHIFARPKYQSEDIFAKISIPTATSHWKSRDVSEELNVRDKRYFFLNKIFARQYASDLGESLLFFALDTSNFHNPQICFEGSGFSVKSVGHKDIDLGRKLVRVKTLFVQKNRQGTLVVYWMVVDKKQVDWAEGKLKEFYFNLIQKKRAGLMGRLDIPATGDHLDSALRTAQDFLRSISKEMKASDTEYLFGANA